MPSLSVLPYRYGRAVGYPLEERREASHDGKCDDFRKLIRVQLADRPLEGVVKRGTRLDQDGHLLRLLHGPLPTVDRSAFREYVDACCEPALYQVLGKPFGRSAVRHVGQHDYRFIHLSLSSGRYGSNTIVDGRIAQAQAQLALQLLGYQTPRFAHERELRRPYDTTRLRERQARRPRQSEMFGHQIEVIAHLYRGVVNRVVGAPRAPAI